MITVALRRLLVVASFGLLALAVRPVQAIGPNGCCADCPKGLHCPSFVHCQPRPPKLKFKGICSKPVCDPCTLENFGYYPTCWTKWPGTPNYSHCPTPPPNTFFPEYTGHSQPYIAPTHVDPLPTPHTLGSPAPAIQR